MAAHAEAQRHTDPSLGLGTAPSSSILGLRLTFAQGFLAGQLSVVIIALLVIRYIIFEDARTAKPKAKRPSSMLLRTSKNRKHLQSFIKEPTLTGTNAAEVDVARVMSAILAKVHYEMDSHASESIDWVSVIVAQALAGYRQDVMAGGWTATDGEEIDARSEAGSQGQRTARDWMEEILNVNTVGRGMSFLDPIQVSHVEFGESYPVFSNAKVRPADDMGRMRVEVDVDYTDSISLAIETKLLINLPRPRFAVLPISLGLTIERFSGTLAIELFSSTPSPPLPQVRQASPPRSRHELHFSLHPDFTLDATATSLVGSRAKLQDLPKIEQLLVGRVRTYIHDRFVWPRFWSVTLPNLVPRHANGQNDSLSADLNGVSYPTTLANGTAQAEQPGTVHIRGPGDAMTDEDRLQGSTDGQDGLFFETAPPLFPGVFQHHPDQSLPGTLPAVEAWRSHAAASGSNSGVGGANLAGHGPGQSRSALGSSKLPRNGAASSSNGAQARRPELRHRTANGEVASSSVF